MTSFAKACIDFSNNLKNLRFSKSSSPPGLTNETDPLRSKVQSAGRGNPVKFSLPFGNDITNSEPPNNKTSTKDSTHESKLFTKKKNASESSNPKYSPTLSDSHRSLENSVKYSEVVNCTNLQSSATDSNFDGDLKSFGRSVNKSESNSEPSFHHIHKDFQKSSHSSDSSSESNNVSIPNGLSRFKRTDDGAILDSGSKLSCRFSMKAPLSPTMAHRLAILARNCQISCGNSNHDTHPNRTYSSSVTSSPIMPHRGATVAAIKQRLLNQGLKINLNGPIKKINGTRYRDCMRRLVRGRPLSVDSLWQDTTFLTHIFSYFARDELLQSCLVCRTWRDQICRAGFYNRISFHINMRYILNTLYISKQQSQTVSSNPPVDLTRCIFSEWDTEIEGLFVCMLKSAISRHLGHISLVHVSDYYISLFINALIKTRYPNTTNASTDFPNDAPLATSTSGSTVSGTCILPDETSSSYMPISHLVKLRSITESFETPRTTGNGSAFGIATLQQSDISSEPEYPNSTKRDSSKSSLNSSILDKPHVHKFSHLALRCCSIIDQNLTRLVGLLPEIQHLELQCCNELTELVFWTCLLPTITKLTIFDCINVSDESMSAFAQLLPELQEFSLQAYHITDAALCYFSPNQRLNLRCMELVQCMDITNQGIINLAYALPNLRVLNLSGCTKFTDDGLDVICENLKRLVSLDLSWCAKISDSGLECVACDLVLLQKLTVDRCTALTDLGISHLATMPNLQHLSVRWCSGLSDGSIPHLLSMTGLTYLCLSGCKRITEDGICTMARHPRLRYLELAHLPAASLPVRCYLNRNLPDCKLST